MTRDLELVRRILMLAEKGGNQTQFGCAFGVTTVAQHVEWMIEAGLIIGTVHKAKTGVPDRFEVYRPTWEGLEFLANAKDEETWQKVKSACGEASFGVVSALLHEAAMRKARARM